MSRTKQCARKSTGGKMPRNLLAGKLTVQRNKSESVIENTASKNLYNSSIQLLTKLSKENANLNDDMTKIHLKTVISFVEDELKILKRK